MVSVATMVDMMKCDAMDQTIHTEHYPVSAYGKEITQTNKFNLADKIKKEDLTRQNMMHN